MAGIITTRQRRAIRAPAAAAVLLLAVTACSSDSSDGNVASAGGEENPAGVDNAEVAEPSDADVQALDFAECMRENGIDMPDPAPGQRGLVEAIQHGAEGQGQDAVQAAFVACQDLVPQFDHQGADHQREREEMILAIAECMREQGLDVPDDLGGLQQHQGTDEEFDRALEVCRNEIVGGQ